MAQWAKFFLCKQENLNSELMGKPGVAAPTSVSSVPAGRVQRRMAPRGSPASLDKMASSKFIERPFLKK